MTGEIDVSSHCTCSWACNYCAFVKGVINVLNEPDKFYANLNYGGKRFVDGMLVQYWQAKHHYNDLTLRNACVDAIYTSFKAMAHADIYHITTVGSAVGLQQNQGRTPQPNINFAQSKLATLKEALAVCEGSWSDAAKLLGTSRTALWRLRKRHPEAFTQPTVRGKRSVVIP